MIIRCYGLKNAMQKVFTFQILELKGNTNAAHTIITVQSPLATTGLSKIDSKFFSRLKKQFGAIH